MNIKIDSGDNNLNIAEPNNSIKIDFETGLDNDNQNEFNLKVPITQDDL